MQDMYPTYMYFFFLIKSSTSNKSSSKLLIVIRIIFLYTTTLLKASSFNKVAQTLNVSLLEEIYFFTHIRFFNFFFKFLSLVFSVICNTVIALFINFFDILIILMKKVILKDALHLS